MYNMPNGSVVKTKQKQKTKQKTQTKAESQIAMNERVEEHKGYSIKVIVQQKTVKQERKYPRQREELSVEILKWKHVCTF